MLLQELVGWPVISKFVLDWSQSGLALRTGFMSAPPGNSKGVGKGRTANVCCLKQHCERNAILTVIVLFGCNDP